MQAIVVTQAHTTCRIDIHGQTTNIRQCGRGCQEIDPLTVEPTMPGELQGHLSLSDWERFRSEINTELGKITRVKQLMARAMCVCQIIFFVCFIGFAISGFSNVQNFGEGGGLSPFTFWIALPVVMVALFGVQWYGQQQAAAMLVRLRSIVADVSARHSHLTFVIRDEFFYNSVSYYRNHRHHHHGARTQYIEVTIAATGGSTVPAVSVPSYPGAVPVVAATPVNVSKPLFGESVPVGQAIGSTSSTLEEALLQIDQLKNRGLLSEAEYQAKRAEIIARI